MVVPSENKGVVLSDHLKLATLVKHLPSLSLHEGALLLGFRGKRYVVAILGANKVLWHDNAG